jgi:hypothetical protein
MQAVGLCGRFPLNEIRWPTLSKRGVDSGLQYRLRGQDAVGAPMYSPAYATRTSPTSDPPERRAFPPLDTWPSGSHWLTPR